MTIKRRDFDSESEATTRRLIQSPNSWPMLILPLKNNKQKGALGLPKLGYLLDACPDCDLEVREGNVFDPHSSDPVIARYTSVDLLISDGWRVD